MSETREAARERARELRAAHRKSDRRRRLALIGTVAGGILVAAVIVAVVILTSRPGSTRAPSAAADDGFRVGVGYAAVLGTAERLQPAVDASASPTATPTPTPDPTADATATPTPAPGVLDIRVYYDYACAQCGLFEQANGEQLHAWLEQGAATVEYHPLAIFTSKSAGTKYSLRAANAVACVSEYAPDDFYSYHRALFEDQPDENEPGPTDDELAELATELAIPRASAIADCIRSERFKAWVKDATERALQGPLDGTDLEKIEGTPTILVNGQVFAYTTAFDPNEFAQFVARVAGQSYSETATPTPTPAVTETPAP